MTAETIDYATGEVISSTDLVPFQPAEIEHSAEGVVAVLTHARQWLASAVEMTGPAEVAAVKATVAMAATYSRELQLSREIQLDAQEMVRRAEYALGKAVRQGQDRGELRTNGQHGQAVRGANSSSPANYFTNGDERVDIYVMADADPVIVEEAIAEARAEGQPTRANVIRKIKGQQSAMTRDDRAKEIARLAGLGYSTRQIAPLVGVGESAVYEIQKDYGISIPADRHIKGTRRIDTNRIISQTVSALEGIAMTLDLINPDDIDQGQARTWLDSLTESLKALSKAKRQIKESLQ